MRRTKHHELLLHSTREQQKKTRKFELSRWSHFDELYQSEIFIVTKKNCKLIKFLTFVRDFQSTIAGFDFRVKFAGNFRWNADRAHTAWKCECEILKFVGERRREWIQPLAISKLIINFAYFFFWYFTSRLVLITISQRFKISRCGCTEWKFVVVKIWRKKSEKKCFQQTFSGSHISRD